MIYCCRKALGCISTSSPIRRHQTASSPYRGFLKPPYGLDDFEYVWTDRVEDDRDGWLRFLDLVDAYRAKWPDLKLVHFASFERDQIRAYAKRYGMEDHPTVTWLLDAADGPLYDIRKAVTQNLVLPLSGPDHGGLFNAHFFGVLVDGFDANTPDVTGKTVGVFNDKRDGIGAVSLVDTNRPAPYQPRLF